MAKKKKKKKNPISVDAISGAVKKSRNSRAVIQFW